MCGERPTSKLKNTVKISDVVQRWVEFVSGKASARLYYPDSDLLWCGESKYMHENHALPLPDTESMCECKYNIVKIVNIWKCVCKWVLMVNWWLQGRATSSSCVD